MVKPKEETWIFELFELIYIVDEKAADKVKENVIMMIRKL